MERSLILYSWASEEGLESKKLDDALKIVILCTENVCDLEKIHLDFDSPTIFCSRIIVSEKMIFSMAHGIDRGPESDRLVPRFPYWEWHEKPIVSNENMEKLNEIIRVIVHEIVEMQLKSNVKNTLLNNSFFNDKNRPEINSKSNAFNFNPSV